MDQTALVLFSGSQDAGTCLAWALVCFARVKTIGFAYGQRHAVELGCHEPLRQDVARLNSWSEKLGADHMVDLTATIAQLGSSTPPRKPRSPCERAGLPNIFASGRNLLFLTCADALVYRHGPLLRAGNPVDEVRQAGHLGAGTLSGWRCAGRTDPHRITFLLSR